MTREQELENAIDKAVLPPRDYRIYRALFKRAEWKTGVISARWQPRSLRDIARDTRLSVATICRALNHLESHGWIARHRAKPGRGHATVYELLAGMDCDCLKEQPEPMTDAERMRRCRRRKKDHTTDRSPIDKATPEKASQIDVTQPGKASQIDVTKRLNARNEGAGQRPFPAKEGRSEGRRERGVVWTDALLDSQWPEHMALWPEGTIGAEMNRSTDTSRRRAA